MQRSKLGTMVAIVATAAGFSALAGTAHAQISGSIGGDIVARDPVHVPGGPAITSSSGLPYVSLFGPWQGVGP